MTIDNAMKKLAQARKRLEHEQGRIARRNAREAMLGALRAVRAALDEEYPAIRKERTVAVKMTKEAITRRREAKRKRMVMVGAATAAVLAKHKIPVEVIHDKAGSSAWYAPRWVVRALLIVDAPVIAEAVRSRRAREKIDAMLRLGAGGVP